MNPAEIFSLFDQNVLRSGCTETTAHDGGVQPGEPGIRQRTSRGHDISIIYGRCTAGILFILSKRIPTLCTDMIVFF